VHCIVRADCGTGFPATVVRYVYEDTGAPITIPTAPVSMGVASRKVHGAAGTFNLPLSVVTTSPTIEPREGPAISLVFKFDKPMVLAGNYLIPEGVAFFVDGHTVGNDVVLNFTAVPDQQYVTITFYNFESLDGGFGGSAIVRLGLLAGDVNQNRVVTLADLALVNAQLAQPISAANFLKDVNVSGTLSLADKGITNANLTHSLPPP
jgi:hypothetical protein